MYKGFSYLPTCSVHRDAGVIVKNVEVTSGEVFLNLNEELFYKRNSSHGNSSHANEANIVPTTMKLTHQKQSPLSNITKSWFPEKVHGILMLFVLLGRNSQGILYIYLSFLVLIAWRTLLVSQLTLKKCKRNQVGHLTNKNNFYCLSIGFVQFTKIGCKVWASRI